jgi:hypothetical protein
LTNPVENAIAAAQRRGELNNLSGAGKPLAKSDAVVVTGMASSELLSKRAEFEMRRAIRNKELENIGGEGKQLKYKGTGISPTIGDGSDGGGGGEVMGTYILQQAKPSAADIKKIQK